jgi:hypothetical protein
MAYNITNEVETITMDDDVPVWEVGDTWVYNVAKASFQLNQSGQMMSLDLSLTDLEISVLGTTSSTYKLTLSGDIGGLFDYDDGAGTNLGGILFITSISGELEINQANLAAEQTNIIIKSIAILLEHPFILPIPIPLPMTITLDIRQETPRSLLDFPLFDGKEGLIPETDLITSIKVESIVLRILNSFTADIPEEIYLEQNFTLPMLLYSVKEEQVPVEAGNYTAYNIEFFQGLLGSLYYAPDVGNYIKATAELNTMDMMFDIKGELTSTTYS